ncbi:hypothetical protein Ddc_17684 [Ditylenchus destructor]|nr:hypothetical protein Ddc_17684 [Ditylenchus destructor]
MLSKESFVILVTGLMIVIVDIADGAEDSQPKKISTGRGGAGNWHLKAAESEGNTDPTQQSRGGEMHTTGRGGLGNINDGEVAVEEPVERSTTSGFFGRGGRGNFLPKKKLPQGEQNKSTSVVDKEAPKIGALAFEQVPEGKITI